MSVHTVTLALLVVFVLVCGVQRSAAMNAEVRIYKEPEFKRLRQIVIVSAGNLCYDMPCEIGDSISSAIWTGLPVTGTAYADGQARIAFYKGANCTGQATVVSTSVWEIPNFAAFGMDNVTSSFAVLETSTVMKHKTKNVCK